MSAMESPQAILRRRGLRPKKAWGQNFLSDPSILDRIAAATRAGQGERVIELGAGLGHLTARLAARGADVVAIERDRELVPVLEEAFRDVPNVRIVAGDAAAADWAALSDGGRVPVVGNLPYHLSSSILFHALDGRAHLSRAVFLLQREVAERLAAPPGGRDYGVLTLNVAMWASVELLFRVPSGAFHPRPEVDSAVVRLEISESPRLDAPADAYGRLVRAAFSKRRKTLRNALKGAAPPEALLAALAHAGVDPEARPETLSPETFAALARYLAA